MHLLPYQRVLGKHQACLNVLRLKHRILLKNLLGGISGRQHAQDVLYGDAPVSNDGLPTKYFLAHCYAFEQFIIRGHGFLFHC